MENLDIDTEMGWSKTDQVFVRGFDLCEDIIGHLNLGDMLYLEITGRMPSPEESTMVNAVLSTIVEHGLTPSTLAARLTYTGAPEAIQGAVASGILGVGSVFVGTLENSARMLQQAIGDRSMEELDFPARAGEIVEDHVQRGEYIPGLGHPIHKPDDPRTTRLFELAGENGFHGKYIEIYPHLREAAEQRFDRVLPVNGAGALGAIISEMGFSWRIARGFAVVSRAVGIVGHLKEEMEKPLGRDVWLSLEEQVSREKQAQQEGSA